jgi:hypothetical protein
MSFNILRNIQSFLTRSLAPKSYILGAVIGGGLSLLGSKLAGDRQEDAARRAAAAMAFDPADITAGGATTTFDKDAGLVSTLSPELQALRDQFIGRTQEGLEAFQTFDPTQAGQLFTDKLTALAAPREEQARLGLENRLFKQGLLSSSAGAERQGALDTAQALAQGARDVTGLQFGQSQQDRLFQQALGNLQAGTGLDALTTNQINQSLALGGRQSAAAAPGAQLQFGAAQNQADAMSGFFNSLGQGVSNLDFGSLFGTEQDRMLAEQNRGLF